MQVVSNVVYFQSYNPGLIKVHTLCPLLLHTQLQLYAVYCKAHNLLAIYSNLNIKMGELQAIISRKCLFFQTYSAHFIAGRHFNLGRFSSLEKNLLVKLLSHIIRGFGLKSECMLTTCNAHPLHNHLTRYLKRPQMLHSFTQPSCYTYLVAAITIRHARLIVC